MAAPDELICSEVHTFTNSSASESSCTNISRFTFSNPLRKVNQACQLEKDVDYDSDGDAVVARRDDNPEDTVIIEHDMATPLATVGRQVWRGSLLLADYVLHNHQQMKGMKILELGSGTGLTSIIAALCGASVTSTDIPDQSILNRIISNLKLNKALLSQTNSVKVKALDLKVDNCDAAYDYILAGDLVYDDSITDALVTFIGKALAVYKETVFLVSLEKIYVFTVKDLDTVAPAHQHFITKLQEEAHVNFTDLNTRFRQYFCYDRTKDMVLIEIRSL
jgi:predicted nicotinamide N-methyase